jgi:hypothetical protein
MVDLLRVCLRAKLNHSVALFDIENFRNVQVTVRCDLVRLHEEKLEERTNCLVAHFENLVGKELNLLAQVELEVKEKRQ